MPFLHYIGAFFLFSATILLIVVSVSTPIWTKVYFLSASFIGNDRLILGNWGYCVGSVCSKKKLGYSLETASRFALGDAKALAAVVRGLSYALILNPIAAGFTFVAFLVSFSSHTVLGIAASFLSLVAFLITAVAFALDLAVFNVAKNRLNEVNRVQATLGNAIWLVLAALVLQLLASCTVCFTSHRSRSARRADREGTAHPIYSNTSADNEKRGFFSRFGRKNRRDVADDGILDEGYGNGAAHEAHYGNGNGDGTIGHASTSHEKTGAPVLGQPAMGESHLMRGDEVGNRGGHVYA